MIHDVLERIDRKFRLDVMEDQIVRLVAAFSEETRCYDLMFTGTCIQYVIRQCIAQLTQLHNLRGGLLCIHVIMFSLRCNWYCRKAIGYFMLPAIRDDV